MTLEPASRYNSYCCIHEKISRNESEIDMRPGQAFPPMFMMGMAGLAMAGPISYGYASIVVPGATQVIANGINNAGYYTLGDCPIVQCGYIATPVPEPELFAPVSLSNAAYFLSQASVGQVGNLRAGWQPAREVRTPTSAG